MSIRAGMHTEESRKSLKHRVVVLLVIVTTSIWVLCDSGLAEDNGKSAKSGTMRILTSFSPDFYTPFIDAYKKKYPSLQVQILNKKTTAAITEILRGNTREFDVFWSSSPDAFAVLKEAGKLKQTGYTPEYLPLAQEQLFLGDTDGYFYNFAISGVGFMWNEKVLAENEATPPSDWNDLAHSRFYGHLAMSTPSRSGTNHLIVESLLQGMGWADGWRYLLQASGNLETITARSFSVPDGVASGRFGAGLVIDFLAINKMHQQKEIGFSYGYPVFLMPAGVGVLHNATNSEEAVAFIDFLFSREGQEILLDPSIGRLPVSATLFSGPEPRFHPLLKLIHSGSTRPYNTELSRSRYLLVNTLFDQLVTYRLLERRRVWKMLLQLEKRFSKEVVEKSEIREKVLELLCDVPVSEEQSLDKALNDLFNVNATKSYNEEKRELLQQWERFVTIRLQQATDLLLAAEHQLTESREKE